MSIESSSPDLLPTAETLLRDLGQSGASGVLEINHPAGEMSHVWVRVGRIYAMQVPGYRPALGIRLLSGGDYHQCCHSNLTRALAKETGLPFASAEPHVHDVLNVFMCTGFTADTHQYFMKASPVRPGDFLEFMAEIDLIVGLSACPGGDCGDEHTSDKAVCHPLLIEVFQNSGFAHEAPPLNAYDRSHGR